MTRPTVGEERQRALALEGEQTLGREQLAAPLEPRQQLALADQPDLAGLERQRAAAGVVRGLGVDHDRAPSTSGVGSESTSPRRR